MSAQSPKVSIIVPVYNVEKFIERCAISVLEQTYGNLEYIFVNDCATDNSIQVLEEVLVRYPSRKKNTKIVHHEMNRGLAAARNTGMANVTGELVFHVDSDDYVELDAVETLVNQQLRTKDDIVSGMILRHDAEKDVLLPHPHYQNREEMVLDMIQLTINHSLVKRLIRKSLYDDNQISAKEGVNCGEDCWTMTQLAYYAKSFSFVDKVVYHYDCTRDNSYMSYNKSDLNRKKIKDDIATFDLIRDFFKDKEMVYYDEINRVAIEYIRDVMKKAASLKDSELFYELQAKLEAFDSKYWSHINWDRGYNRLLSRNLCVYRLLESVKNLYGKLS